MLEDSNQFSTVAQIPNCVISKVLTKINPLNAQTLEELWSGLVRNLPCERLTEPNKHNV